MFSVITICYCIVSSVVKFFVLYIMMMMIMMMMVKMLQLSTFFLGGGEGKYDLFLPYWSKMLIVSLDK